MATTGSRAELTMSSTYLVSLFLGYLDLPDMGAGHRLSTAEIEAALIQHPGVSATPHLPQALSFWRERVEYCLLC